MKAAKKRYFKKIPKSWKILKGETNNRSVKSFYEEWAKLWSADTAKYYAGVARTAVPVVGSTYFDVLDNTMKVYNGAEWKPIQ